MSVGGLAGALAHAMRQKREQRGANEQMAQQEMLRQQAEAQRLEQQQYSRGQDTARTTRQGEQDALQRQVMAQQMLDYEARRNQTGTYAPKPTRDPVRDALDIHEGKAEIDTRYPKASSSPDGTDAKAITREDARRRALITNANSLIREQPKNIVTGGPIDMAKVGDIGAVRDSLSSEIGAPAPDERVNPLARFTAPPVRAGHMEGPSIPMRGQPPPPTPPTPPTPPSAPTMDPEELAAARQAAQGYDPETAAAALAEAGFSPAEIRVILGGGD